MGTQEFFRPAEESIPVYNDDEQDLDEIRKTLFSSKLHNKFNLETFNDTNGIIIAVQGMVRSQK